MQLMHSYAGVPAGSEAREAGVEENQDPRDAGKDSRGLNFSTRSE